MKQNLGMNREKEIPLGVSKSTELISRQNQSEMWQLCQGVRGPALTGSAVVSQYLLRALCCFGEGGMAGVRRRRRRRRVRRRITGVRDEEKERNDRKSLALSPLPASPETCNTPSALCAAAARLLCCSNSTYYSFRV
ncbi:unnamed protein product [Pleuronectes platessa]|uniref:Uncharacterized protein n=1 Tax=Pleuronectes platessa TaxID=8262 RepID=A0A9N7URH7_PLEPL|nr:unnamed protein product [Pleuronectes platessa]